MACMFKAEMVCSSVRTCIARRLSYNFSAADAAAFLAAKFVGEELDPVEAVRIRKKIDRYVPPL